MIFNSKWSHHGNSSDSKHWQHEVCVQCSNWRLDQHRDNRNANEALKLMTTDECMRLKRDLRHAVFTNTNETHFWMILLLVLFIIFCMALALWLLAKAFVFSQPPQDECGDSNSQDRQMGGRSSVDDIMQQLQENYTASTHNVNYKSKNTDGFYVPANFWDRFPMNEFGQKSRRSNQKLEPGSKTEVETGEDSEKDQDNEPSAESSFNSSSETTQELNKGEDVTDASSTSEVTNTSVGDQSQQSSDSETTSETKDVKRSLSIDSLGHMPTSYGQIATNTSPDKRRRKIRWANWLRRSHPVDFQV